MKKNLLFSKKRFLDLYNQLNASKKDQFKNYIIKRKQRHKFHIVSPSPWPLLTGFSALILVSSLILWMHYYSFSLFSLLIGIICILLSMYVWFRDIIRESIFMGYHTQNVQFNIRFGFTLFILSEIMFFFGFFWSLLHFSLCPSIFGGNVWPPEGIINFFISQDIGKNILVDDIFSLYFFNYYSEFFSNWSYKNFNFNTLSDYSPVYKDWFNSFKFNSTTLYLPIFSIENYNVYNGLTFNNIYLTNTSILENKFFNNFIFLLNNNYLNKNFQFSNNFYNEFWSFFQSNKLITNLTKIHINFYSPGVLVDPLSIPLLNTVILLSSGVFLTYSHMCLKLQKFFKAIISLILTIIFGIFFFICQVFEYSHSGFSINDGVYGSTFYMLTGFHGFHVFIGTIFLIVCLIRFFFQHFTPLNHFGYEAAIWYWHFVDVVWILLFFLIYYWPNIYFFNSSIQIQIDNNNIFLNDSILNYPDLLKLKNVNNILADNSINLNKNLIELLLINNKEIIFEKSNNLSNSPVNYLSLVNYFKN